MNSWRAWQACRPRRASAGLPVIHVQVGFRPGMPEISDRNALFAAIKSSPQWRKMFAEGPGGLHAGSDRLAMKLW